MPIPTPLRGLLGFGKRALAFRSLGTAAAIQRNLPTIVWPLTSGPDGKVVSEPLGLTFDAVRHESLLRHMRPLAAVVASGMGSFEMEGGVPVFVSGPIRMRLDRPEIVGIVAEVFGEGIYDVSPGRDALVLDVGMNVGLASLYFAQVKGWEVVAYEPFPETFEAGRRNVDTSGLQGRIETHNAGLSDLDATQTLPYDSQWPGRNGLFYAATYDESHQTQEIRLVDAAPVVRALRERAGSRALVVKMDCEGAEYAIFDRLSAEGLLGAIDAIVMEYHPFVPGRDGRDLERMLLDAGFTVHLPRARAGLDGLLWAVRAG